MLPSSVNKPWAGSDRYKDFGAQYHSQPGGHARSVHPRVLSVYASTCHFGAACPLGHRLRSLIFTLQHSIRGLWLGATPAGFPPACLQTISSSLIHRLVRRLLDFVSSVALLIIVAEHSDDMPGKVLLDFSMTRNRLRDTRVRVAIPVMLCAVSNQYTAESFNRLDRSTRFMTRPDPRVAARRESTPPSDPHRGPSDAA